MDTMLKTFFELNELVRKVHIGHDADEHGVQQEVMISMRVMLNGEAIFRGDTYTMPYDYCDMIKAVDEAIAAQPHFILQETLFFFIARRVLSHPLIEAVDLNFSKTRRYTGCRSIGIQ